MGRAVWQAATIAVKNEEHHAKDSSMGGEEIERRRIDYWHATTACGHVDIHYLSVPLVSMPDKPQIIVKPVKMKQQYSHAVFVCISFVVVVFWDFF